MKGETTVRLLVTVENAESDALFDVGKKMSPSGGKNWELIATEESDKLGRSIFKPAEFNSIQFIYIAKKIS